MKKIIILLCCMCIALSGCSLEVGDMESEYLTSSFDGVWRQVDYNPTEYLEAVIDNNVIKISMIYENGSASAVYWYGTIPTPSEKVNDYQWASTNDLSKIHPALTYSADTKKHFVYVDGEIWFPYHMDDYSVIMRLERVDD